MYKPCPCCHSLSFDFCHLHCCLILMYVFRMLKVMMIHDSEYRSGPALCQRHAGAIATLASYRNGKQPQSVASLLSRPSCQILQGKRFVEDGTDARYSFLFNPLSNTVHDCDSAPLTEYPSLSNLQTKTRHRLHGPWRETRELACQRRTDHATAVRCPSL